MINNTQDLRAVLRWLTAQGAKPRVSYNRYEFWVPVAEVDGWSLGHWKHTQLEGATGPVLGYNGGVSCLTINADFMGLPKVAPWVFEP
jgi:hypothetical protein